MSQRFICFYPLFTNLFMVALLLRQNANFSDKTVSISRIFDIFCN
jgi:hypothetical protein